MSRDAITRNAFTHGPLGPIFAKTALPIILVMSVHGLMTVIDAIFLGVFVGPDALVGVSTSAVAAPVRAVLRSAT